MIEEQRQFIHIAYQLLSQEAIIKKCRKQILQNHLMTCVACSKEEDFDEKLKEFVKVLEKMD